MLAFKQTGRIKLQASQLYGEITFDPDRTLEIINVGGYDWSLLLGKLQH